jgi:hypothetical protein
LSPVMGTSQERRPCRESNATWTGPLSEAMPACRGRRADHAQKDRVGTWEIPRSARAIPLLVRIGKGEPKADDERTREVGPSSSSCEAGEQGGAIRRGAGGAKGWDQGECEPAAHGPDAEPGNRVTGAGAHTSNRKGKNSDLPSLTRGRSRMRESRTYGSGAARLAAIPAGASPANRGVQSLL